MNDCDEFLYMDDVKFPQHFRWKLDVGVMDVQGHITGQQAFGRILRWRDIESIEVGVRKGARGLERPDTVPPPRVRLRNPGFRGVDLTLYLSQYLLL